MAKSVELNLSLRFTEASGQKKMLRVGSESVKAGSASYLLRVRSKLRSGRVGAHLYSKPIKRESGYGHVV